MLCVCWGKGSCVSRTLATKGKYFATPFPYSQAGSHRTSKNFSHRPECQPVSQNICVTSILSQHGLSLVIGTSAPLTKPETELAAGGINSLEFINTRLSLIIKCCRLEEVTCQLGNSLHFVYSFPKVRYHFFNVPMDTLNEFYLEKDIYPQVFFLIQSKQKKQ